MPQIRYLKIGFNQRLKQSAIPFFRAAIIEKTNREVLLFHNHTSNGFNYQYPLIQYKRIGGKASIICLNQGTEDIHYLLKHRDLTLQIGNQKMLFEIEDVQLNYFQVEVSEKMQSYRLTKWLALNQKNYQIFTALSDQHAQKSMLERILVGNILSFAKGIDWTVEQEIKVRIKNINKRQKMDYKGTDVIAFSIDFSCNVILPRHIGLGKGVALGFGNVGGAHNKRQETVHKEKVSIRD